MGEKKKNKSRSQNALVHGVYAKDVLLPWDSRDEFEKLHGDLKAEFRPRGRAEEETLLDLAFLFWRKQALWRMWQLEVLKDPFSIDILETGKKSWSGIRKRLRSSARSERALVGTAEAQLAQLLSEITSLNKFSAASDQQEVKLIEDKISAVLRTFNEHAVPLMEALQQLPNAEKTFDAANSAEKMDKIVRLEAALDARISKALARLVGLKEFKRTPAAGMPTVALPAS
jgi:hypothetical protein